MKTYAFIDHSNLSYGGVKSLGWGVDYKKLLVYLKEKYGVTVSYFFAGVDVHDYRYDYLKNDSVPLAKVERYLRDLVSNHGNDFNDAELALLSRNIKKIRFYKKLKGLGYELVLKPVKEYRDDDGKTRRKANCDVDLAYYMLSKLRQYDRAVVLSGDGDFLPVLKHVREDLKKEVFILARGPRTAREVKQFAGSDFRDFVRLESHLKYEPK